ncbi:Ig-like domain-containing protein [Nonomuraea endophytica]|uniref:SbsA Ig-like domain-containing protein n=1 Tax=Nonomuraea endophytica TaxID=714136 RepID=A0A7W8EMI1_9ACTN|nr:Ig-like domain-containing protein [Nonomuraea endophytica]MBB5083982.1 hypothetical protein [Nonomuraea endophytica]
MPADSPVAVTFSEPVTDAQISVLDEWFEDEVPGTTQLNPARTVLTFTPSEPWMDSLMAVTVSGARDAAGNTMSPHTWRFGEEPPKKKAAAAPAVERAWTRPDGRTLMVKAGGEERRPYRVTVEVRSAAKSGATLLWSGTAGGVRAGTVARLSIPIGKVTGRTAHWRARVATGAWSAWQRATTPANDVVTAAAPPPDAFALLGSWQSQDGKRINYRKGYWDRARDEGFGNVKIVQKHDLDALSAHQMTKHPHRGIVPDPFIMTRYHYQATAYRHTCSGFLWWRTCKVTESRDTRTIVDFNTESSKYQGTLGVLTAYCEGITVCPPWMKRSFGAVLLPVPG